MKRRIGYLNDDRMVPGELVSLTTRAAADAVEVFFRYTTGYADPIPTHVYHDTLLFRTLDASIAYLPNPECPLCGKARDGLLAAGDETPADQQILACTGGDYAFV
jgi:hypothetical protein